MKTLLIIFLFAMAFTFSNMNAAEEKCITHAITIPKMRLIPNMEFLWLCIRYQQYDNVIEICNTLIDDPEIENVNKIWYIRQRSHVHSLTKNNEEYEKDMELLRVYYFSDEQCKLEIESAFKIYFE